MNILLHICCSNCVTYPFRILNEEGHTIKGFWFNPNIHPSDEHSLRLESLKGLAKRWGMDVIYDDYDPSLYFSMFGMDDALDIEGIELPDNLKMPVRCTSCYNLRLRRTVEVAKRIGSDAFTTTLLISPYQDYEQIVMISRALAAEYNIEFYLKDFRVYFNSARSLSRELGLYRQKYCGCIFSKMERDAK
ncbi:MAG: epoxyqueuosine reductase QueH [Thermodesulfovibrionia bacterium]